MVDGVDDGEGTKRDGVGEEMKGKSLTGNVREICSFCSHLTLGLFSVTLCIPKSHLVNSSTFCISRIFFFVCYIVVLLDDSTKMFMKKY